MTNQFLGLARGPIDHNASSVINSIANEAITMGSAVNLFATTPTAELLPRVEETDAAADIPYGIAVGGDTDGNYGDGSAATDDSTRATASAGQGIVIVTQGRCLARVLGASTLVIGDKLIASSTAGVLTKAGASNTETVIARALQDVADAETDIIAVDVQREGEVA